jgi:hypothetical protein
MVLAVLKTEAERLGIPYQTYIGSVLYRFAHGELIDRNTVDLLKQLPSPIQSPIKASNGSFSADARAQRRDWLMRIFTAPFRSVYL